MNGDEVVIVGGGVIGLSIAYELAREGVASTVVDSGALGRAASWAGAGIIAPGSEKPPMLAAAALRDRSAALHAVWAEALRDETGIDNGYRRSGGVDVALAEAEEQALSASAGRWRDEGIAFERLAPSDFPRVEPALNPAIRVAYYLPDRAQIRNPRHLKALASAIEARGGRLLPNRPVEGFETKGDRVERVLTRDGPLACDRVVLAAGPWSEALLGRLGLTLPTPPIKGQIVLLRCGRPPLRRIVERGRDYLVPRDDGRVLVGSTEEDAGFDTRPTTEAVRDLIDQALRICPSLAGAEVERAWAGLRPGSLDTRPYLGHAPGWSNLIVATGHQRSGLNLSPATAEVVADLVLGRPPRIDLSDFRPDVGRLRG